jgi:hypothetical protein
VSDADPSAPSAKASIAAKGAAEAATDFDRAADCLDCLEETGTYSSECGSVLLADGGGILRADNLAISSVNLATVVVSALMDCCSDSALVRCSRYKLYN